MDINSIKQITGGDSGDKDLSGLTRRCMAPLLALIHSGVQYFFGKYAVLTKNDSFVHLSKLHVDYIFLILLK